MKWQDGRESQNVEDRRGSGGGGGRFPGGGKIGIGTIVIALAASYFFGIDPSVILGLAGSGNPTTQQPQSQLTNDEMGKFIKVVLGDTEDTWAAIFKRSGQDYRQPHLVLFSNSTSTDCGQGNAASGPFYCPADETVYIDLNFYELLRTRFKASGDFAQAYVIAHEVGHHVQNMLGATAKMQDLRGRLSEADFNKVSVRMELQADCYAGVWAHRLKTGQSPIKLDPGDVEEALNAAAAIGDDTLQKQATGHVVPESFTHGTSQLRVTWLKQGIDSGDMNSCDTFDGVWN